MSELPVQDENNHRERLILWCEELKLKDGVSVSPVQMGVWRGATRVSGAGGGSLTPHPVVVPPRRTRVLGLPAVLDKPGGLVN